MKNFALLNRIVGATVFASTLICYFVTVAPTVAFWDCGEFITTSYILGIPHPPGAPLYTLLGRIFSMMTFLGDEIALRVNFLSVMSGAITVLFVYLCVVRLLTTWLDRQHPVERIAILVGGAVAAFSVAFSTSFWGNSSEAEVYGLSMCITVIAYWLALRWDDGHKNPSSDRPLLLIAYLFGLGAGVHLQALLTVPGILILVFSDLMEDQPRGKQIATTVGLILYPIAAIFLPSLLTAILTIGIFLALLRLRPQWKNPLLWASCVLLFGLGFSTYFALFLRSGLNPLIDMNNPESWENFKSFLGRQQYGTHFSWPRRADFWSYQINIHIKYFLQQFPFYNDGFLGWETVFRRAVPDGNELSEIQKYSMIPLAFGIGGAYYHWKADWKRFGSVFSMFALMGVGLVLYLNMPDPEPREREYIFVGAYTFFGCWMGIGAAGLIVSAARSSTAAIVAPLVGACCLILPLGILDSNYFSHDRHGDTIPFDYAYNILETCEPNAILFTNGDNDTYPLWFLQHVEGIRRDVRIVNLSLIKTAWYIEQLRDLEPAIPMGLTDDEIKAKMVAYPWTKPEDLTIAGMTIKGTDIPTARYRSGAGTVPVIEAHTVMIWWILNKVNWSRPVYFAVTVPNSNQAGLRPYLSMEGMAYRVVPEYGPGQFDPAKTKRNLMKTYRYRGINQTELYKDPVARRLLGNYLVLFEGLTQALTHMEDLGGAFQALQFAEANIPPHAMDDSRMWQSLSNRYRDIAGGYHDRGDTDSAIVALEHLIRINPSVRDADKVESTIESWKAMKAEPEAVVVP
ncbi:MAG: DUF2723 domain-containing protein [Candidatus Latescibacterota bacterium]|nr:DUF2723 domain-containing protein [Candidatus Latescibacterota bacterium]